MYQIQKIQDLLGTYLHSDELKRLLLERYSIKLSSQKCIDGFSLKIFKRKPFEVGDFDIFILKFKLTDRLTEQERSCAAKQL